ncbi:hypothetical protein IFT84_17360 [Rhizobium sp. CFBP 8762]|uniref:hypothetical protein n=1 Tax=Rhizobium sp. CFBP 8762 TaxID=2775279 RepID=UPI0017873D3B|nr:hypothetical protein [Rhizobium sp. CFBP 8762]MBD8556279.1 hypothetical protein [Rhizobium sp. CFBP 8762]
MTNQSTRPETPPDGIKELIDAIFGYEMVPVYQIESYNEAQASEYWDHVEVILNELGITPEEAALRITNVREAKVAGA